MQMPRGGTARPIKGTRRPGCDAFRRSCPGTATPELTATSRCGPDTPSARFSVTGRTLPVKGAKTRYRRWPRRARGSFRLRLALCRPQVQPALRRSASRMAVHAGPGSFPALYRASFALCKSVLTIFYIKRPKFHIRLTILLYSVFKAALPQSAGLSGTRSQRRTECPVHAGTS